VAKRRRRKTGEFAAATCHRCELPLDEEAGTCPNDRCPFHFGFQEEVNDDDHPSEEGLQHIEELRVRMDAGE